jgi:hypothetical protein
LGQLPLNRHAIATIAQHRRKARGLGGMRAGHSEDEPMKPQAYLITLVLALMPALQTLFSTSA